MENAGAGDLRLTAAELARIDDAFPAGPSRASCPCSERAGTLASPGHHGDAHTHGMNGSQTIEEPGEPADAE